MKLTNTSSKVINIGTSAVLPGETITITDKQASLPSIATFVRMRLVSIENDNLNTSKTETSSDVAPDNGNNEADATPDNGDNVDEAPSNETTDELDDMNKEALIVRCTELGIEFNKNENKEALKKKIREFLANA